MKMTESLCLLWHHVGYKWRIYLSLILLLSIATSILEIISIGAVMPFLAVIMTPEKLLILDNYYLQTLFVLLKIRNSQDLLLAVTIAFVSLALIAGGMRLLLLWSNTRLACLMGLDISLSIYKKTLYQPYSIHIAKNSSSLISGIANKTNIMTNNIIMPTLILTSSAIMLFVILISVVWINPIIAIITFGGFSLVYYLVVKFTKLRISENSIKISQNSTNVIKSLQEGLGGIRDVIIDGSQELYCKTYQKADFLWRNAESNNIFISHSPRYILESLGILLIAILAYALTADPDKLNDAIPLLGLLAMSAQKALPLLQHIYSSLTNIRGAQSSLSDILDLLNQEIPIICQPKQKIVFDKEVRLSDLSFSYKPGGPFVLEKVNYVISKGVRLGIVGSSGSGKSTLIDIIMGLLQPTDGSLEVDDTKIDSLNLRSWQVNIAHVSQSIFISDASVAENIAFGVPSEEIDYDKVEKAAKSASLHNSIITWPNTYNTVLGERGSMLSGGQRQRIGIARALYKESDVIIFDEATSALDLDTEASIIAAIEKLGRDKTVIMIAHRLSTLENCDEVIEVKNKNIIIRRRTNVSNVK
jgi:ABC-type multidrug transport system fused ATPase/permease subunit